MAVRFQFAGRLARLREALCAQSLDALVVTSLPNIRYLTGFTGTAGAAVIAPEQSWLVVDFRYAIAANAAVSATTGLDDVLSVAVAPDSIDETVAQHHEAAALAVDGGAARCGGVHAGAKSGGGGEPAGMELGIAAGQEDGVGGGVGRFVGKRREGQKFGPGGAPVAEHVVIGEAEGGVAGDGDPLAERRQAGRRTFGGGERGGRQRCGRHDEKASEPSEADLQAAHSFPPAPRGNRPARP